MKLHPVISTACRDQAQGNRDTHTEAMVCTLKGNVNFRPVISPTLAPGTGNTTLQPGPLSGAGRKAGQEIPCGHVHGWTDCEMRRNNPLGHGGDNGDWEGYGLSRPSSWTLGKGIDKNSAGAEIIGLWPYGIGGHKAPLSVSTGL